MCDKNLSLRMLTGVGKQRRGFYLFQEEVEVDQVKTCDLWHQRLNHHSNGVMSLFSSKIGFFENKGSDESCYVLF